MSESITSMLSKKSLIRGALNLLGRQKQIQIRNKISSIYAVIENFEYDPSLNGEHWLIRKLVQGGCKTFVDVGANIGDYTLAILREDSISEDLAVYAFEPSPATYKVLASNISADHRAKLYNVGLSSQNRDVAFYEKDLLSGRNTIEGEHTGLGYNRQYEIQVLTGDIFFTEIEVRPSEEFDLIKIDVEGHELEVIKGFEKTLRSRRIGILQFERATAGGTPKIKDFYNFLEPLGYKIGKLYPNRIEIYNNFNYTLEERIGCNWVAVSIGSRSYNAIKQSVEWIDNPERVI